MDANEEAGRRKVLDLIQGMDYALFTTRASGDEPLHARPMAYRAVEGDGDLWFFTNVKSRKVAELRADPTTLVCFADPKKQHFVTIAGESQIIDDAQEKKRRWSEVYRAWFPGGPEDDNVALLRVHAARAEYWDTPTSAVVYAFGYIKAAVTGQPSRAGEVGAVKFD